MVDYLCYGGGLQELTVDEVPRQKIRTFGLCQTNVDTLRNGTFYGANITNIKISYNRQDLQAMVITSIGRDRALQNTASHQIDYPTDL